jgi:predicted nucleotidyltransferase
MKRIVERLEADARVAAAWLTGSIGRGEDDAWSDLDLHVAVYDQHLPAFWSDMHTLYARIGRLVLIQQEMASNAQAGGHFQLVIFDGPLEVDWNVGPLSLARRTPWHELLFMREDVRPWAMPVVSPDERRAQCQERLAFLWAMAPIAVKYIARGDTSRAVGQIGLVRNAFIALWRLVETGCGTVNGLNQPLEPELKRILPFFGPTIDPKACRAALRQLCDRTVELHPRLAALGVAIPEDMPAQLTRLTADEGTTS